MLVRHVEANEVCYAVCRDDRGHAVRMGDFEGGGGGPAGWGRLEVGFRSVN